jgi:16S rRNA (adenine1518-N6/adenine1519-N6)-dimethyltransferase
VRLDTYEQPIVDVPDDPSFFKVVRAGFGQRRKQLKNALAEGLRMEHQAVETILLHADIDPRRRAETLTLEEWATLTRVYLSD